MHDLLTASLESLPEIIHTKDGSAVVRELIVRGNAKVSAAVWFKLGGD
jgi:pumilio family protein 6